MEAQKILSEDYKGQDTTVFQVFKRERTADDIRKSSLSLLMDQPKMDQPVCVMPLLLSLRKGEKMRKITSQLILLDQLAKISLRRVMMMTSPIR